MVGESQIPFPLPLLKCHDVYMPENPLMIRDTTRKLFKAFCVFVLAVFSMTAQQWKNIVKQPNTQTYVFFL